MPDVDRRLDFLDVIRQHISHSKGYDYESLLQDDGIASWKAETGRE